MAPDYGPGAEEPGADDLGLAREVEVLLAEYGFSLEDVLDGLSVPQIRALLRAREQRQGEERRWQVLVAAVPLHLQDAGEYIEQLLGLAGGEMWYGDTRSSGDVVAPAGAPLLHEITDAQAALLRARGFPISVVKVAPEEQSGGPE